MVGEGRPRESRDQRADENERLTARGSVHEALDLLGDREYRRDDVVVRDLALVDGPEYTLGTGLEAETAVSIAGDANSPF